MVKIIRKKKRLFEEEQQTQPAQAPANNGQQPATNTAATAPANTNNNQPAPVNNGQQQAAPTDANNQQQTNDVNQQPQQQNNQQDQNNQQQQQPNATQQAVLDILKNMENQYWAIANNVPDMIKEKIPDFKPDNAEAAPIIKNWDAFKQNPSEQTFNAFIDSFKTFGTPQHQDQQQNVQESLKKQKTIVNFRSLLEQKLSQANQDRFIENVCKYYF